MGTALKVSYPRLKDGVMSDNFQIILSEPDRTSSIVKSEQGADMSGAVDDSHFVRLWLSRYSSPDTRRAYLYEAEKFLRSLGFRGKGIRTATFNDAREVFDELNAGLAPATAARCVDAIRSLFSLAMRLGYIRVNVVAAIDRPKIPNELAARIMTKEDLFLMIAKADADTKFLIRLLYFSAMRVSEAASLRWKDVIDRENGRVQLVINGKGGKTRFVLLPTGISKQLRERRREPGEFVVQIGRSDKIKTRARRIEERISEAAAAAELSINPSPHWMRHAHASHALDAGAKIHVLRDTLGHSSLATTGKYSHARPGESTADYLGD